MYFCTSSLPDTRMKVQSVWCATARASSVFPVPGGPYSSTPCRKISSSVKFRVCYVLAVEVASNTPAASSPSPVAHAAARPAQKPLKCQEHF